MKKITVSANDVIYRLHTADRTGIVPLPGNLDRLIPEDHPARLLWAAVESLDLGAFHLTVKSMSDHPGVPATDPKVLLALWLFALSNGVVSGREVDRLCTEHLAYMWLCGGISTNYHTLNDFRVANDAAITELFTQIVGRLVHAGLVDLNTVAHDGMRIRASAGASSFHRVATIDAALETARAHLHAVMAQAASAAAPDDDAAVPSPRQVAARQRAAAEMVRRLEQARQAMEALRATPVATTPNEAPASRDPSDSSPDEPSPPPPTETTASAAPGAPTGTTRVAGRAMTTPQTKRKKKKTTPKEPRVSTTDPDAHVMHMPDGGFRPAYNEQLVTETSHALIVAVEASTNGSDLNQTVPMVETVKDVAAACPSAPPKQWLTDGGFLHPRVITTLTNQGIAVIGPLPETSAGPMGGNDPAAREWRERMATPEMKELYKQRAATVELANARGRCLLGLYQIPVRGLRKVRAFLTLVAIAYNVLFGLVSSLRAAPGAVA